MSCSLPAGNLRHHCGDSVTILRFQLLQVFAETLTPYFRVADLSADIFPVVVGDAELCAVKEVFAGKDIQIIPVVRQRCILREKISKSSQSSGRGVPACAVSAVELNQTSGAAVRPDHGFHSGVFFDAALGEHLTQYQCFLHFTVGGFYQVSYSLL